MAPADTQKTMCDTEGEANHAASQLCSPGKTVKKEGRTLTDSLVSGASSERMRVTVRLESHVSPFTRKAPALVEVSTSYPTSDPVRSQPVHSREFGSDRLRQNLPLRFVADVVTTSFTQDNCLSNTRGRHRWDLSSIHSANRKFFSTYSASQQKVQISHRKHGAFTEIFRTKAAEDSGYKRKTWKEKC